MRRNALSITMLATIALVTALSAGLEPILARYGLDFTEDSVTGQCSLNAYPSWSWQPDGIDYQMLPSSATQLE